MAITIRDLRPEACEECGMGAVNHRLERLNARINFFARVLFRPFDRLAAGLMPLADRSINTFAPFFSVLLFKSGLAVKASDLSNHHSETAQALFNEAHARGIEMYEVKILGLSRNHFIARFGKETWAFEGLPRPARRQNSMLWIDDKAELKKRFFKAGFPVAAGGIAGNAREALNIFRNLKTPVIVKPQEGSGGRHTTVHIETEPELLAAFRNARIIAPRVVVEEELAGPVFRATLIEKKLVAVLRRDPPHVTGDGRSTIAELVAKENENPLRRGPVFAKIDISSPTAERELARQNLAPESVLAPGQKTFFHFKVNWGVGGISYDVTGMVHPDNRKLFEDIGAYLGDDIVGIDFIISDIARSWRKTERCGVIELNSLPLIGNHHFPYSGPVQNVAGAVWDMVFPKSKARP